MAEELNNATPQGQDTPETEKTTFTKEEVEALLQKETDKRVTQALKTQEKKNLEKLKEAEKLAKMSAEEKYVYELEQREKALEEKERQLTLLQNKTEAIKILADKGLRAELVDFVLADDAETMNANIKRLEKFVNASVNEKVTKILAGNAPKIGTASPLDNLTPEAFRKLSLDEKQKLKDTDPELYNSLKTN